MKHSLIIKSSVLCLIVFIVIMLFINSRVYSFTDTHLAFFGCGHKYADTAQVNVNLNGYWQSHMASIRESYDVTTIGQALRQTGKYKVIVNDGKFPIPINSGGFDIYLDSPGINVEDPKGNTIRLYRYGDGTWNVHFIDLVDSDCSVPDYRMKQPYVRMVEDMQISRQQRQAIIDLLKIGKTSTASFGFI